MTIAVVVILTVWLLGSVAVAAVCRAAARGDRVLESQIRARRLSRHSHEHPLAA